MTTAVTARNAAERASIALEMLVRTRTGDMGRAFSGCFEMNDGDQVVAEGLKKLRRSARYRAAVRRHPAVIAWREYVRGWDASNPNEANEAQAGATDEA